MTATSFVFSGGANPRVLARAIGSMRRSIYPWVVELACRGPLPFRAIPESRLRRCRQPPLLGLPDPVEESSAALTLFYIHAGDQLSLLLAPVTTRLYQPRGISALQCLFKGHFQSPADQYEAKQRVSIFLGPLERQNVSTIWETCL